MEEEFETKKGSSCFKTKSFSLCFCGNCHTKETDDNQEPYCPTCHADLPPK